MLEKSEIHCIEESLKHGGQPLRGRLLFEELLSAVSARFINIPSEQVDAEIHKAMRDVLDFFEVDRFALLETFPDRKSWAITHCVCAPDMPPVPIGTELPGSTNPWAYEKLIIKREVLSYSNIDEVPNDAKVDKRLWTEWGIRSNLVIPIMIGGPVNHIIAFNSVKDERFWPGELIPRLKLLGEVFVNVIQRKNAELELRKSQTSMDTLINSTPDMIWSVDATRFGLLTFNAALNEYFLKEVGLAIKAGMSPADLFDSEERVRIWNEFYKRLLGEGPFTTIYETYRGNRTLRLNFNALRCGNDLFGISVFAQDITDLKRMDEQLRGQLAEIKKLKYQAETENIYLREEIKTELGFGKIIGSSDSLHYILFRAQQVAPTDATVLVLGETGTGKGMVAHAIHEISLRKDKAMITVNCAALPADLVESELFGREKGAFTGAHARQAGRFEIADNGTIFLDEIGELPLELQSKLLRVLQDGEFERLGSPKTVKVDVRVIASTSRNLKDEVRSGRFREDLYYRLNTFPVTIPPLRCRIDDIPELTMHFMQKYARKFGRHYETIARDVMQRLQAYEWPGNIRELEHVVERAVITSPGPVFRLVDQLEHETVGIGSESIKGFEAMAREHILQVLQKTFWKIEGEDGAAALLGMNPSTLRFRIKKLGITRPAKI